MSIVINDITPLNQFTATNLQTVFNVSWTADATTDIVVYARASGASADDVTDLISSSDYTVAFVGGTLAVRVTFAVGRTTGDIVTLTRDTPATRDNLYINTNFTPTMLNGDFARSTFIEQQNQMFHTAIGPRYNTSETLNGVTDLILPLLGADEGWAKNTGNTAIVAIALPSQGVAPIDATYITQTASSQLDNEQALAALGTGLMSSTTTTGVVSTSTLTGTASEIDVINGTGVGGNPTVGITDNPAIPGTAGMQLPTGTTAQRAVPISPAINLRYNTDLVTAEYYDHSTNAWVSFTNNALLPVTDNAVARFNGTTGQIQDSSVIIDDADSITGVNQLDAVTLVVSDKIGVGLATPLHQLDLVGDVLTNFTATQSDVNAFEIDCNAAGFGGVSALDITYTTGAQVAGAEESAVLINIDDTISTGGEVYGVEVLVTPGASTVTAMRAGALVNPLEQLAGTFANAATVLNIAVDVTAAVASGGAGAISIFVADNDTVTISSAAKFEEISFQLSTGSSGGGVGPTFEFSTGVGTWTAFSPTDGTNAFKNTGVLAWDNADVLTWAVGTGAEYLIRITRTKNTVSTTPIVDVIQVAAVVEYGWDKDAAITAAKLDIDNIRVDGNSITSTNLAGDINLTPNGTGNVAVTNNIQLSDSTGVIDENGNEQIVFKTTASAVNYVEITNAATGNGSLIKSAGSDTNIDLNIRAQGTGDILFDGSDVICGDPGTEASGIDVNGTTFNSVLKVSNIGSGNEAQFIMHRHSTTLAPVIVGARSNSDTSSHIAVTAGQSMLTMYGVGWTGTHYDIFGGINIDVDATGTISSTSSPGRLTLQVTPDGSNVPATAVSIANDKTASLIGNVIIGTGSNTLTINSSTAIDGVIDDDTMATASATTVATSESMKAYVDGLDGGSVKSVTGTANQVDVDNTDAQNPIVSLSSTAVLPGTLTGSSAWKLQADSTPLYFGAGDDATIQYDGTNLLINPQAVGSGDTVFSNGNVGIGTASPNNALELRRDAQAPYFILNRDNNKFWGHSVSSAGNYAFQYGISYAAMSSSTPHLVVEAGGNVGIGTASPDALLDTNGTIRSTATDALITTGAGLECRYSAGVGSLLAYDRGASSYKGLILEGSSVILKEAGTDVLTVNNGDVAVAGSVGIGTASPSYKLHIDSAASSSAMRLETDSGVNTILSFLRGSTEVGVITGVFDGLSLASPQVITVNNNSVETARFNTNNTMAINSTSTTNTLTVGGDCLIEDFVAIGDESTLTIATGVITVTGGFHRVDTEAAAASDPLITITSGIAGQHLTLKSVSNARTVVVTNNTGNLRIAGDMSLDSVFDTITLVYSATDGAWLELSRANYVP